MMLPLLFIRKRSILSITLLFVILLLYTNWGSKVPPLTGIIVAITVMMYYLFMMKRKVFYILLPILIVGSIIAVNNMDIVSKKLFLSASGRIDTWMEYFDKSKLSFITGKGLGAINIIAKQKGTAIRHLHNEYMHFLVEIGLIGLLVIIYCIWDYFKLKVKQDKIVIILKAVFLGFILQAVTLYPAHLWIMASVGMFSYASLFCIRNEKLLNKEEMIYYADTTGN